MAASSERRRVLVVGCGAMGGIVAAALSAQADVAGYDTDIEHVRAMREHGLRVSGPGVGALGERVARFPVHDDPAALAGLAFDAIVFLIKSKATAEAVERLRPALGGRPVLVTLQNGMGNDEVLLRATDLPVARGVMMEAARCLGPGRVEHLIRGQTWLGPRRGTVDGLRWLADLLTRSGLPTELLADPMGAVWSKFVFNSVMNPIGALLLGVNAARYEVAEVRDLIDDMAAECRRVVAALGGTLAFDPMDYVTKVRAGQAPLSTHAGSMALDVARGAPTEIDELTGYIVREGERLGIAVPTCKTVYRLVKGLELAARHVASR
jgi:2-dehydropantoate 2-reductase